jgi:hypothetical protein
MAARGKSIILRVSASALTAAVVTFSVIAPASAGFFERLFGGFRHAVEEPAGLPANVSAYADPSGRVTRDSTRAESGLASANCVRLSDGFHFPVQAHAGVSAAEACHALCPASETKLYSGGAIDNAVAHDGGRYADLDTAFLYRKQLVAGSTCNGRDVFGLARVDVTTDPTLRPGDIVATKTGLVAVTGIKNKVAEFAPIGSDRAVPQSTRDKLAAVKIMPPNPGAPKAALVSLTGQTAVGRTENRSAQLSR